MDDSQQCRQEEILSRLVWPRRLPRGSRLLPDINLERLEADRLAENPLYPLPDSLPFGFRFGGVGGPVEVLSSESEDGSSSEGGESGGSESGEHDAEPEEYEEEEDGVDVQDQVPAVVGGDVHGHAILDWRGVGRGRFSERLGGLNIRVSPEDDAVIGRLMQVGIDRATVLQVYEVCEHDEDATMNCLLSMT
jgi:hypothetical protein